MIQEEIEMIKTAYEILTDPQRKLVFDKIGEEGFIFLPYIKGVIPIIKCVLSIIFSIIIIITVLVDLWIVLLLIKAFMPRLKRNLPTEDVISSIKQKPKMFEKQLL